MIMYTGNLDRGIANYLQQMMSKQETFENASKFPPYTKVRFKGNLYDLLPYVNKKDEAKAILFDGGIGEVLGCNNFTEGKFYTVSFGEEGYHNFPIPEHLLEKI